MYVYVIVFLMVVILFILYRSSVQEFIFNIRRQPAVRKLDTIVGRYKYMMEDFQGADGSSRIDDSCTFDEYPNGNRCLFKDYVLRQGNGYARCVHPTDTTDSYGYNVLLFKNKEYTPKSFKDWLMVLWSRNGGNFERKAVNEYVNHCQNAESMAQLLNPTVCPPPFTKSSDDYSKCVASNSVPEATARSACDSKTKNFPNSISATFSPASTSNPNHTCQLSLKCPTGYANSSTPDEQYSNVCVANSGAMSKADAQKACDASRGYFMNVPDNSPKHMCRVLF